MTIFSAVTGLYTYPLACKSKASFVYWEYPVTNTIFTFGYISFNFLASITPFISRICMSRYATSHFVVFINSRASTGLRNPWTVAMGTASLIAPINIFNALCSSSVARICIITLSFRIFF